MVAKVVGTLDRRSDSCDETEADFVLRADGSRLYSAIDGRSASWGAPGESRKEMELKFRCWVRGRV